MRKCTIEILVVQAALVTMVINFSAAQGSPPGLSGSAVWGKPGDVGQLQVTGLQILFRGQPVEHIVTGAKAKLYTIDLIGSGFDASSTVFIGGRRTVTTLVSSTELTAKLRGRRVPAPGELIVNVENSDGQLSNTLPLDVISNPADLAVLSLSPGFGLTGQQVKLIGRGFTPTGNQLRFRRTAQPSIEGIAANVDSSDGEMIVFNLPTPSPCLACFRLLPGEYMVSVINANGMSNSLRFLVSEPDGPIGVWGVDHLRVEVSDYRVRIDALCFSGLIQQTLHPDGAGHFEVEGVYFPMIGPIGGSRPATYSGSIAGGVMTLEIKVEKSSALGPFELQFGTDVQVIHPCV